MGADLENSRHHSQFLISNSQFPIFNFLIFIFKFQLGITGMFSVPKPKSFEIESS